MCGNLFGGSSSPKVEKVAPAPQEVSQSETAAVNDRISAENKRRRAAQGADWARNQAKDTLMSQAQSGTRQTLG